MFGGDVRKHMSASEPRGSEPSGEYENAWNGKSWKRD
jgi:hypothetical protein